MVMDKSEAIEIAQSKFGINATYQNAHYSKVNSRKDVWWLEVSLDKIKKMKVPRLYFLLQQESSIAVLDIPTEFLRDSADSFRVRHDKNNMCFEIDITSYKDVIGPKKVDLRQFLVSP
ncbi:hypothetical protein I2702_004725 [Vibrio parahaemolyticus]|nr:hypothetical protein [Vibrio parahaemolyticus]MBY7910685.1 hypothetical protein [Vibrio fluvialis]NOH82048.1 hypothetical protein [Vibrio sp. RE86]MBY7953007.1 hypothetical protein [Vibrio fluvialis]MBY8064757.1 hypothetical protein [Vibrio fluvialis]